MNPMEEIKKTEMNRNISTVDSSYLPYTTKINENDNHIHLHTKKLNTLIQHLNINSYQLNKPHRNLIISGMTQKEINFLITTLNKLHNIVCFDNTVNNVAVLPQLFFNIRESVRHESTKKIMIDEDVVIGLYMNIAHLTLNEMQELIKGELKKIINEYGYSIIVIINNPIQTITEWNQNKNIPEYQIVNENLSTRWKSIKFVSNDRIERQAQVWNLYATFFWELRKIIKIYTYEQIIMASDIFVRDVCNFLSLPILNDFKGFKNIYSQKKHFQPSEIIKQAVLKYCPMRLQFGYSDLDSMQNNILPGIWDKEPINFCRLIPMIA